MPSERERAVCNSIRRVIPNTRQAHWIVSAHSAGVTVMLLLLHSCRSKLVDSSQSCCFACNWNLNKPCALSPKRRMAAKNGSNSSVKQLLGSEPPQYNPADQEPHQYIQQLLQWGTPPGASLEGCVTPPTSGRQAAGVDLAALHAAGCFPHAWQVPLTAAGVQAANRRTAARYAADPAGQLQEAMQKGLQGAHKHTLKAAEALNRRAVEADSSSSSKRAREVDDADEVDERLGQAAGPPLKRRMRSAEQQCLEERFEQLRRQRQQQQQHQQRQRQQPQQEQQQQGGTNVHAAQPVLSRQALSSALSSLAAGITERKVEDARAAVVSAASNLTVNSMLRPLQLLMLASKGGKALQVRGAATSLNVTHA
jgi:hypothetical protein